MNSEVIVPPKPETILSAMKRDNGYKSIIWFLLFSVIAGLVCFVTKHTLYASESYSSINSKYTTQIEIRKVYKNFQSLSNMLHLEIIPKFVSSAVRRTVKLYIKGQFFFMGENRDIISSPNVSLDLNYQVEEKQKHVIVKQFHNINFSSCVAFIDVSTDYADLESVQLQMVSINSNLLRTCLILIIMFCILSTVMLIFAISKRARPESSDQLYSVVLMGCLFLIDGPWLVFCYYNVAIFSTIFDIMIQIFHVLFILYMLIFFKCKSKDVIFDIYNNKILYGCVIAVAMLLIVLQFVNTDGISLCIVPVVQKNIPMISSIIALFTIFHIFILILMTYGFVRMQFECVWALILLIILFFTLEIINIAQFFIRSFVDLKFAGLSCAFDTFYIVEANLVSMFLVFCNTPIIKKLPPQVYAYYRNRLSYSEP